MAEDRMVVLETVRKAMAEGDVDFLREGVRVLAQAVMETEVSELTGLPKGERDTERRLTSRNGYREGRWDTRVGTLELSIPRVRDGSYFPSLLEPRRRAERALLAVVQEAYVLGVSTRRVEDLVEALGIADISRSEVSRICAALDAEVQTFRSRPLSAESYPYLWLDATYVKVREGGRVVSLAALVATGVAAAGGAAARGQRLGATRAGAPRGSDGSSNDGLLHRVEGRRMDDSWAGPTRPGVGRREDHADPPSGASTGPVRHAGGAALPGGRWRLPGDLFAWWIHVSADTEASDDATLLLPRLSACWRPIPRRVAPRAGVWRRPLEARLETLSRLCALYFPDGIPPAEWLRELATLLEEHEIEDIESLQSDPLAALARAVSRQVVA